MVNEKYKFWFTFKSVEAAHAVALFFFFQKRPSVNHVFLFLTCNYCCCYLASLFLKFTSFSSGQLSSLFQSGIWLYLYPGFFQGGDCSLGDVLTSPADNLFFFCLWPPSLVFLFHKYNNNDEHKKCQKLFFVCAKNYLWNRKRFVTLLQSKRSWWWKPHSIV